MKCMSHEQLMVWIVLAGTFFSLLGAFGAEGGPQNLLRNGGFEEIDAAKGTAKHWRVGDWGPENQRSPIAFVSIEDAVEGKTAAKIQYGGKGTNLVVYQDVNRRGLGGYLLKLKCKPPQGRHAYASVVTFVGGKIAQYLNTERKAGNGSWQETESRFITAKETQKIRVILRSNGEAAFDEVSLVARPDVQGEPSTGQELKKAKAAGHDVAADKARKARMTPEELAWEKVLEENLGSFYLPHYKRAKVQGRETGWDYLKDDPNLPRVLPIGDSISRGYTLPTRHALAGKVNLHRAPANCGPTAMGLRKLAVWLGDGKWDLVHFNFGIHDRNSKPDDYAERLEELVVKLKATGAKVVWASSTPLSGKLSPQGDSMVKLNEVASGIMEKHGVPIDDLHAAATPILDTMQGTDGCHFNGEGYEVLGRAVADCILRELGSE